ncbi:MAG: ATP-binding protein [bacterium]
MQAFFKHSTLSLRLRVIFSIILLLVIIGGTFSFLTVRSIHELIEEVMWENYASYARSFAAFSAKSFAEGELAELQRHLSVAYAQQDMIFVVAKDDSGNIVAQTGNLKAYQPFEIHKNIFEDQSLRVQEIGTKPKGLFHSSGHTFLITTQVVFENRNIGLMQLAVNTASANQRLAHISLWGFKMAIAVVALGTVILVFVDRRLRRNIIDLIQITRRMATGDLSQRVEIKTGDEIEHLGESFNMMAEAIKRHEHQLEQLVEQRTRELQGEKNKLQLILDNVPSAFLMLNTKLQVESVSSQFETVLNKRKEDVIGKTCALSELLYKSDSQCPSRKALKTGKVQSAEAHILNPVGEDRFLEHMAIPIMRNDHTEKILEIVTDITARKRFEEQLIRTEKLSATGEMAAIIAHEMRNSLSSVNLILQCMTDSFDKNTEEAKSLDVAIESVNRMEAIVRQLLAFAKPSEIKFQSASINELVEQSLAFCRYQLQRKQIKLQKNLGRGLPLLDVDVEMMREALINLLLNATDAVQEKGMILVETVLRTLENTLKGNVEPKYVSLKKGQKVVDIRVTDNGRGIPSEDLGRIFDPFFTSKTHGTGLGLTMAKRAVGEHGGLLLVESKVSLGSTFSVLLPLKQSSS